MPEDSEKKQTASPGGESGDDVRKRFAALEKAETSVDLDDLPPVPQVKIERPGQAKPQTTKSSAGSGYAPLIRRIGGGAGMYSGGGGDMRQTGQAFSIGTNLVASIIVGTGAGWLVDKYLLHSAGTPWGMIVGFMLGVTAGFISLVRTANQLNK